MKISEYATINAPHEDVWNHLLTLQDAEKYIPIVTKSEVNGTGIGTTRTCDIHMGEQKFQITEILSKIDYEDKSMTISIDNAPPPLQGLKINFSVTGNDNSSEVTVDNDSEHTPESEQMIKGVLRMITSGLKKFHEQ